MQEDLYYHHTFIQDLLWDGLHYLREPIMNCWPFNKIRERAIRKTIKYMCYGAESKFATDVLSFGSQIWDTTLATQAIIASNMADEYGDSLKKAHIKKNPAGDFESMYRCFTKGAWALSNQDQGWVVSDCTAESLKVIMLYVTTVCLLRFSQMPTEIVEEKADNESLYDAVNVLVFLQSPESGGFASWEPPVPLPAFQMLNPSELFADIVVETE
ncbi:hypothetical protein HYC85_018829 [Camellia sinensis]|uniref:Squalene cyclase C-terminal domain-containing protein n=1 Tax=Camellia sinensis TaxID=4442 RepID=A0A7J7GVD3_CAMSI|nr:hypothetical protein HYC85_018829 [Camellia sinensis]